MSIIYVRKSGFIEDKEIFDHFKKQATDFINNDLQDVDEPLRKIIVLLNKLPGLATRFCCSGHIGDEGSDNFHIITVIHDEETYSTLEWIVYNYNLKLCGKGIMSDADIFSRHLSLTKHGMLITDYQGTELCYPTVSIDSFTGAIVDKESLDILEQEIAKKVWDKSMKLT